MGGPTNLADAISRILESEQGKNLLSPVTSEVGEFLGTVASLARFYITDNLERIFTKWANARNGRPLDPEGVKKIMPLLPVASMVSDAELQEKWVALLETTVTDPDCLPSFGETLSQLSVEEVQYLDRLWKAILNSSKYLYTYEFGRATLDYVGLIENFDPSINAGLSPSEYHTFKEQLSEAQQTNYKRLTHAKVVIDDLIRIGILAETQVAEPDRYVNFGEGKIPIEQSQTVLRSQYSFSRYGVMFMQAVTPKAVMSAEA